MRAGMICVLVCAALVQPLRAQDHRHVSQQEEVGSVAFANSCAPTVSQQLNRAVAMLHSFWFDAAEREFSGVAAADPTCAIAQWGLAMTYLGNPFTGQNPSAALLERGTAAARRAQELAAQATHREQMYAQAAVALYQDHERVDVRTRMRAHAEALRALHAMHADDPEARIFYARALIATAPASDLEFRNQRAAAELLQPLFERQPEHPGIAHYLIHSYDYPPIASKGLRAARRYASIAPAAPHALHMPSHIFTRLGMWDESIETNDRSAQAEPNPNAAVHPLDYMVYAYLQQGRVAAAREVVQRIVQLEDRFYGGIIGYNFAAMPARYVLERSAWNEAGQLRVPENVSPFVAAVTRFARGIGAARSGNVEAANVEVAALAALRDALRAQNDPYWPTVVEAQRLAVAAWAARARGDNSDALRLAEQSATLEETVEKHPVTPGPLLPARELYADLLADLGRFAEAQREYEQNLQREPRRARSLFGAARAAERAGNTAAARAHYQLLLDVMRQADADRPEPQHARRFIGH